MSSAGIIAGCLGPVTPSNPWDALVASLGPVIWFKLDESGSTAVDSSGNGLNGIYTISTVQQQPAIYANMGLCAEFVTNAAVSVASTAMLRVPGDVTIVAAIKRNGTMEGTFAKIMWKPTDAFNGKMNYGFFYNKSTNKITFRVNSAGNYFDALSATTFADATPYLLFGRRSAANLVIWDNGAPTGSGSIGASDVLDNTAGTFYVGNGDDGGRDQFTGFIDEVIMFDYALSDVELGNLWAARA